MEGVQGVVDCGALGVGRDGGGVRGHDVFTHTHTHIYYMYTDGIAPL